MGLGSAAVCGRFGEIEATAEEIARSSGPASKTLRNLIISIESLQFRRTTGNPLPRPTHFTSTASSSKGRSANFRRRPFEIIRATYDRSENGVSLDPATRSNEAWVGKVVSRLLK
jgi:hypothetical protein